MKTILAVLFVITAALLAQKGGWHPPPPVGPVQAYADFETGDLSQCPSMARGFAVIASDIVHTGRYSLNVETGSTEFYELESFSSTYVRVYVYFGSQPTTTYWEVLRVYTSMEPHRVQIATLAILSDRRIQVWNLGAIPAIVQGDMQAVTGAWNCIELKVIPGTGKGQRSNQNAIVEARLDGLMTATSTNGSDFGTISRVTFGYSPGEFGIVRLDDAIARSDGYPGPM